MNRTDRHMMILANAMIALGIASLVFGVALAVAFVLTH